MKLSRGLQSRRGISGIASLLLNLIPGEPGKGDCPAQGRKDSRLGRACWQKQKWVSRHWGFAGRQRETELFPPCHTSLLGPTKPPPTSNLVHLQCPPLHRPWQPSSRQHPRAAAPLAVGEVFWLQHEAAHVAGRQAAGLRTGRRLVHGLVLAKMLARSLSLQDVGLCGALRR